MNPAAGTRQDEVVIDPENPWLGLFSYTEANRAYFHGRDEEAAELARRVQRKLLTVLFGQSGLGKTSLLRAGLVPRLRGEGFCPVYVRIDYAPESPPPSEQIKQAIFRATRAAGYWTRPGSSIEGESLWEFLHHRGDLLRDGEERTLTPLLIFDQFEEIFTLAQADDAGRLRAKTFLSDLADLVENRAPAALEERLENDDSAIDDFDFARADYRILIALREDYLAHLESVKGIMPSITQNRMRLARMTGEQALSAVVKPGGRLVSEEVAEAIVRFVAGGSELLNAEIEPSLLSLVCRELNNARIANGDAEISAALLAGSRETILSEFHERALADQPPGVRAFVEDELLTDSGYRESLAEERVIKALAEAGAAPDALATLVNRRLLRIEERLDVRRVELTHDVLCGVVLASRNLRHEREARERSERELAAQREREADAHRALVRARTIATVCAVLMVVAVAGAIFGWISQRRALAAEAEAQKSRSDAEKLVSFLIEDFYAELEPTGRLDTLGKLAKMAVDYYDGLPPKLVTPRTEMFRAMALVRVGAAENVSGHYAEGMKTVEAARAVFRKFRAEGDDGDAVTYGLALAEFGMGSIAINQSGSHGEPDALKRAADLLRPLVAKPGASAEVRRLYGDTLNYLSHTQPREQAVATCDEARRVLESLGALELRDLSAASSYADTADSEARHLNSLGRVDEAVKLEKQVYELSGKVLAQRPGDLHAMADRTWSAELLSALALRQHDLDAGRDYAERAARAGEDEVRFNPGDLGTWQRWVVGLDQLAGAEYQRGEIDAALATRRKIDALKQDKRRPDALETVLWWNSIYIADIEAEAGDAAAAAQAVKTFVHDTTLLVKSFGPEDPQRDLLADPAGGLEASVQLTLGNARGALAEAKHKYDEIRDIKAGADSSPAGAVKIRITNSMLSTAAHAAMQLKRYAEAERLARDWLEVPTNPQSEDDPRLRTAAANAALAHAIAMQGRGDEARSALEPALSIYRDEEKAGASGTGFRRSFAYALYVDALIESGAARRAALDEAGKVLDGASPEAQRMASFRELAGLIAAAR